MKSNCSCQCEDKHTETKLATGIEPVQGSFVSEFIVPKMDCPSEEGMIRMALDSLEPKVALEFDTPNRKVAVFHGGDEASIVTRLVSLGLGATLEGTRPVAEDEVSRRNETAQQVANKEAVTLRWLLAINAIMFVIEFTVGWWAQSAGLIADSLDMFADAAVYGVALYAVGRSVRMKLTAAHLSGWLQVVLALGALSEVIRRFVFGSDPVSNLMIGFGFLALGVNVLCVLLISKSRDSGAHMKASWIFSTNDVIANLGVIIAGALVAYTGSRYPDLVIGMIIGAVVLNGARRILQLKT